MNRIFDQIFETNIIINWPGLVPNS